MILNVELHIILKLRYSGVRITHQARQNFAYLFAKFRQKIAKYSQKLAKTGKIWAHQENSWLDELSIPHCSDKLENVRVFFDY